MIEEKKDEVQETRPGYDVKWVVDLEKVKSDELICGVCKGVVRNHREVECECDALYCYGCLLKNKVCIRCNKSIKNLDELLFSKRTERKIKGIKAKCAFTASVGASDNPEGEGGMCSWTGTLAQTDEHFETCEFAIIDCPFKCGAKLQRRHLAQHNKENLDVHQSCSLQQIMGDIDKMTEKVNVLWRTHEAKFKKRYKAKRTQAIKAIRCDWWTRSGGCNKRQMGKTNIYLFVAKDTMFRPGMELVNPPGYKVATQAQVIREMQKHDLNPAQNKNTIGYWWYNTHGFVNSQRNGQNKTFWLFKDYNQGYVNGATYFPYIYKNGLFFGCKFLGSVCSNGNFAGLICLKLKSSQARRQKERLEAMRKKYKITDKDLKDREEDLEEESESELDSDSADGMGLF